MFLPYLWQSAPAACTTETLLCSPFAAFRKGTKVAWGDLPSKASWPGLYSALRITQASTKETPYIAVEMPEHHQRSTALKWQNSLEDESESFPTK